MITKKKLIEIIDGGWGIDLNEKGYFQHNGPGNILKCNKNSKHGLIEKGVVWLMIPDKIDISFDSYEEMLDYGAYDEIIDEISSHEQPYSAVENYYMGIAYFAMEDFDSAAEYLAKTVEMVPDFLEARDTLAGVYFYAGKKEESIAELKKCIEIKLW